MVMLLSVSFVKNCTDNLFDLLFLINQSRSGGIFFFQYKLKALYMKVKLITI
nr:MAG TPA: hypothetical protein [Myoviridae sp. ct5lt7]